MIEKLPKLDYRCHTWHLSERKSRCCPFCSSVDAVLFLRPDDLPVTFCNQCHCFYVSLVLPEKELLKFYEKYWGDTCPRNLTDEMAMYLLSTATKRFKHDYCFGKLTNLVGSLEGKRILDVGCGFGDKAIIMKSQGAEVLGIDISQEAIQFCKDKLKIDAKCMRIEDLSSSDSAFDIVTMFEFIEHPTKPFDALKAALSIMKKGAFLVIVTPNGTAGERWWHTKQNEWVGFRVDLEHLQYLHVDTIDYLCHKLHYRQVHLEQFGQRSLDDILKPPHVYNGSKIKTVVKKSIKSIPGVRHMLYEYRNLQANLKRFSSSTTAAGDYHLFTILQKL